MLHHYPDLGSAAFWLAKKLALFRQKHYPYVTHHQCGISALVSQESFHKRGGVAKYFLRLGMSLLLARFSSLKDEFCHPCIKFIKTYAQQIVSNP